MDSSADPLVRNQKELPLQVHSSALFMNDLDEDPESKKFANTDQTIYYLLRTKRIEEDDLKNYVWGKGWVHKKNDV